MVRRVVLETDGMRVQVIECAWTPLELRAVFQGLLGLLDKDQFPMPQGIPVLASPSPVEPAGESDG